MPEADRWAMPGRKYDLLETVYGVYMNISHHGWLENWVNNTIEHWLDNGPHSLINGFDFSSCSMFNPIMATSNNDMYAYGNYSDPLFLDYPLELWLNETNAGVDPERCRQYFEAMLSYIVPRFQALNISYSTSSLHSASVAAWKLADQLPQERKPAGLGFLGFVTPYVYPLVHVCYRFPCFSYRLSCCDLCVRFHLYFF